MRPVNLCRSLLMLGVLTFTLVAPLFPASACAEDPTASTSSAAGVSGSNPISKWIGVYDPFSRGCMPDVLTMYESTFSWADCKAVSIRVIAVSDAELAFEVEPHAKCGWAGWIVALTRPSAESRAVDVTAYRSLIQYETKGFGRFCAYVKRSAN